MEDSQVQIKDYYKSKYTSQEIDNLLQNSVQKNLFLEALKEAKIGTSNQFIKADGSLDNNEYLSKSGGTIETSVYGFGIKNIDSNGGSFTSYYNNLGIVGRIGVGGEVSNFQYEPIFINKDNTAQKIWHSGNDGTGSGLDADKLDGKHDGELTASKLKCLETGNINANSISANGFRYLYMVSNTSTNIPTYDAWQNALIDIPLHSNGKKGQLYFSLSRIFYRDGIPDGNFTNWKEIAFTSSNVASADKLITKQLTNEDLNNLKDTKSIYFYFANGNNTCINKPVNDTNAFNLQIISISTLYLIQIFITTGGIIYKRACNNGTWTAWQQLATTDGAVAKLTTKQLTNEDLNSLTDTNFSSYWANPANTCVNKPSGIIAFGLQCYKTASDTYFQILTTPEGVIYKRHYKSSNWLSWKKMLTEDDVTNIIQRLETLENKMND